MASLLSRCPGSNCGMQQGKTPLACQWGWLSVNVVPSVATGKVAFLIVSTVGYCPQNATRPALKYQPVEMRLSSLGAMGRACQGLCHLQITFVPIHASLPVCMALTWGGDMLQSGIYCSASSLSLTCRSSPGLCAPHQWGHKPPPPSFLPQEGNQTAQLGSRGHSFHGKLLAWHLPLVWAVTHQ